MRFLDKMVTKKEQQFLLQLARNAIAHRSESLSPLPNGISPHLKERHGVFVTLTIHHELRGCIGHLLPTGMVYKSVIDNAVNAAYHDPRFLPVAKEEVEQLEIEISLLTDPVRLDYIDASHLLKKLDTKEGLILKKGMKTATFLPQVWEQIPDKKEFLSELCMKAYLDENAWQDSDVEVYAYKVEKFGDWH